LAAIIVYPFFNFLQNDKRYERRKHLIFSTGCAAIDCKFAGLRVVLPYLFCASQHADAFRINVIEA